MDRWLTEQILYIDTGGKRVGCLLPRKRTPGTHWVGGKVKVKCTLVQALRLCIGRTTQRGSRGIVLLFLDHGTRRGKGVSVTPRPLFTSGKDPVSVVQEVGWAPGSVWTSAENLAPNGIRSSNRPACSQSLYRLRYPAQSLFKIIYNKSVS